MKQKGFTLIEILFVIAILGVLASLGLGFYQKRAETAKIEKAALQIQQLLQSAMAYHVDHGTWPINFNEERDYLPFADDQPKNPWGEAYTMDAATNAKIYTIETTTPTANLTERIAAHLPNAKPDAIDPVKLLVQVGIPGLSSAEAHQITIAGIGVATGDTVRFNACPNSKHAAVFTAPNNIAPKATGDKDFGSFTISNLSTYADMSSCSTSPLGITTCRLTRTIKTKQADNKGRIPTPNGSTGAFYIAVCEPGAPQNTI